MDRATGDNERRRAAPQGAGRGEPALSVVVCTRNRAALFKGALESLAEQTAPRDGFEVIVVDNGSTDATREVTDEFRRVLALRYVREERVGLSRARNAGWQQARGAYVAYIDDEVRVARDWVRSVLSAIAEEAPDVLGGPVVPLYGPDKPAWFPAESQAWSLGDEARSLRRDEHVHGEGFVVKKAVLEGVGGFRTDLGVIGGGLGSGEETEMQERIRRRLPDARILFRPDVGVSNLVRPEKMVLWLHVRRCFLRGWQARRIYDARAFSTAKWPRAHCLALACGHAALAALRLLACPLRSRRRHPYWRTYVMLRVLPHVYSFCAHASFALSRGRAEGQ